jgi:hypothetical protein
MNMASHLFTQIRGFIGLKDWKSSGATHTPWKTARNNLQSAGVIQIQKAVSSYRAVPIGGKNFCRLRAEIGRIVGQPTGKI